MMIQLSDGSWVNPLHVISVYTSTRSGCVTVLVSSGDALDLQQPTARDAETYRDKLAKQVSYAYSA